jgi:hypothetical protein
LIEACSICGQDIIDEAFAKEGVILATCHFGIGRQPEFSHI